MAMNLRLRPDAAAALKAEAERTGLSQQEILRQAVDERLGLGEKPRDVLPSWIEPPARPYREATAILTLPAGRTSLDILNDLREERV
jgi:hypothetical protein